jgi:hypothetical protein
MINLKTIIEEDSAVKRGGYSSAIFLTYTLNLNFFEQIIAPALESAGCSNVLILTDPDGYAEALETGKKQVAYAGMRYVCAPIPRISSGVQHSKILFMAGKESGRLLLGSGNLTLNGYSLNLENFSHYEYNPNDPSQETLLAFSSVWKLIQKITNDNQFPETVQRQIRKIRDDAQWLNQNSIQLENFAIWSNYDQSIWTQLTKWREEIGLAGNTLKELRIFSPYYDKDGAMLRRFAENLFPDQIEVYLSPENSTFNANSIQASWPEGIDFPFVFGIHDSMEDQPNRYLHGKLIVGIEDKGAWCISGSANMTRPELDQVWQRGGNLELVTLQFSSDKKAFDYLLEKPASISSINLAEIQFSRIANASEEPRKVYQDTIQITELTYEYGNLEGRLNRWPENLPSSAELIFIRSGEKKIITIEPDLSFSLAYPTEIVTSEAAYIHNNGAESLPRWIDVPESLKEYGSRSYHERIAAKLGSVAGAENLFHELLEFLFDRITPDNPTMQTHRRNLSRQSGHNQDDESEDNNYPVLDPEQFIVPERDIAGNYKIEWYTQNPYERNVHSLRDLLSIVLLKLTALPMQSSETRKDDDENHPDNSKNEDENNEQQLTDARLRLCAYLIAYSKRFGHHMCQEDFIEQISPAILLDNLLTLSRVLIEFVTHVDEFTSGDFVQCYWWIWSPLFWPSIVGIEGESSWQLFNKNNQCQDFIDFWKKSNLYIIFIIMTGIVYGHPPSWSVGLHSPDLVKNFLVLKKLIIKLEKSVGCFDKNNPAMISFGLGQYDWDECVNIYQKIKTYQTPARERISAIIEWIQLNEKNQPIPNSIMNTIQHDELQNEFESYKRHPKTIQEIFTEPDDEGLVYCPRCGGSLRTNTIIELNRGKLVLCSTSSDAWLYKTEKIPKLII